MSEDAKPDWQTLEQRAVALIDAYRRSSLKIVTAESCTGGLVAALLTAVPGSSDVLERGFVTYSNEAKMECLSVPANILDDHGAVSAQTASRMAEGSLANSRAGVSVSITGIAGPGGGSADKPVGLVHLASARRGGKLLHREMRYGDIGRTEVRLASVATAFDLLEEQAG